MKSKYNHVAVNGLVKRLILVQHAHTLPAEEGEPDTDRILSGWGFTQARRLGNKLRIDDYNKIHFIFTSHARRTSDTMQTALEEITIPVASDRTVLHELYPTPPKTGRDLIGETYRHLGYVPYEQYQQVPDCFTLLTARAETVHEMILDHVCRLRPLEPTNCIVFGHVPLLPALAHVFLKAGRADGTVGVNAKELQELNLGEAEGISLRFDDSTKNGYVFEHRFIP